MGQQARSVVMSSLCGRALISIALAPITCLLPGCAANVEIVRIPLVSPVVVMTPDGYELTAIVTNSSSNDTSPDVWMKAEVLILYSSNGKPWCMRIEWFHVGVLAPGASWDLEDFYLGDEYCECQLGCDGAVFLSLRDGKDGPKLPGESAGVTVSWWGTGSLADVIVSNYPSNRP